MIVCFGTEGVSGAEATGACAAGGAGEGAGGGAERVSMSGVTCPSPGEVEWGSGGGGADFAGGCCIGITGDSSVGPWCGRGIV
jgi:hypothetical protein